MTIIGYARISTSDQTLDAQLEELTGSGCARVYREIGSGADSKRRELRRALDALQAGNVLMVTRLDRLARSTLDLLNTVRTIQEKGPALRNLGDAWADTTTPAGRLMLTVLGGLAEFERHLSRERPGEDRARVKAASRSLGRAPKLTPHLRREAIARKQAGESTRDLGRSYNVSASTVARLEKAAVSL